VAALTGRVRALLSLRSIRGIGDVQLTALLRTYGSPEAALTTISAEKPELVGQLSQPRVARRIDHQVDYLAARPDIGVIAACDDSYPQALLELHDPPPILFARGCEDIARTPGVAVVGTRACTEYGRDATRLVCEALATGRIPVVSGLAWGVDRVAHECAIESGSPTIAVIGCGIDVAYPHEHAGLQERIARDGLLLSEFPPGAPALAHHFPKRNRIIAGLSQVVVVIEAPARSGALITVDHALDLGREIMAVPGPIGRRTSEGTNAMIRDGAAIVTDATDVVEAYHEVRARLSTRGEGVPTTPSSSGPAVDTREPTPERGSGWRTEPVGEPRTRRTGGSKRGDLRRGPVVRGISKRATVLVASLGDEPVHADDLGAVSGLPAPAVLAALLELELAGIAQAVPGGRYRLARPLARPLRTVG